MHFPICVFCIKKVKINPNFVEVSFTSSNIKEKQVVQFVLFFFIYLYKRFQPVLCVLKHLLKKLQVHSVPRRSLCLASAAETRGKCSEQIQRK